MISGQLLIILGVGGVTLLGVGVLHRAGVPAAVVLVGAGLIIGFLPFVPDVSLEPEVVLLGLLPLLVFDAAATSSPTAFLRHAGPIGLLAVALVVATAFGVAAVAHWIGHLPWPISIVLGTAVGPTDAAAATSVARRLGLTRRLHTLLEGEALFNDATALVLYTAAVAAVSTGRFSVLGTAGSIVYAGAAGVAIGLTVGLIGRWLRNRIDDPPIEIAGSILLAYAAYLPAEAVHASGVLATVTAGLYLGWHSSDRAFSARSRLQSGAFWETLVFLVNAALFVLVGLSFHTFSSHARDPFGRLVAAGFAVVATVIVVRLACMLAAGRLAGRRGRDRADADEPGWRERLILGWSGMRGAITLAALLAVPTRDDAGRPVVGRDEIVYLGFAVIIVTLVAQGMSLPVLVRRLRLSEHPAVADAERYARLELTRAALDHLDQAGEAGRLPRELGDGLGAQYRARLDRLASVHDDDDDDLEREAEAVAAAELSLRHELNAVQRRTLGRLRDDGRIGATTLRAVEHDLDLEEARLRRPTAP
ncbi:MAG TPA: Na+/H+ antiporter [Solirubrobacteraceae bacterium]|jgi:CPA1 family monovalent cation:H+ antiporter|nr:Na+/H+ antiporter [Solirubrobacteraceae bacterium]